MVKNEDLIEKAVTRKVGDAHPTKPWVWTEYKPGKFDWRPAKGGGTPNKPSASQIANAKAKSGKPMDSASLAKWAKETSEDNLVKVANSKNGNGQMRKIAYDALAERGYDVSKIDTSGSLDTLLKMTGTGKNQENDDIAPAAKGASVDVDGDEEDSSEITEKWYLNPDDDRVKKQFNLKTKEGRIKYDQFVYKMKKAEPDYMKPVEVIQDLNEQYLEFLDNDKQRFMISAGGAGIGKSYGFKKLAEALNMKPFEEGDEPGDEDYDYYEAPDVNSGKQLLTILKAHNGKIILFDDNDKVLRRSDCASVMKKATATTGKRIVSDADDVKTNFEFTGRIMVMTNKNLAALSENEDTKAIISRAMMVSEIYLTVPETIEVLKSRYQDMEFEEVPRLDDEKEDKKERDEIIKLIVENQKNIDPAKFTVRTFQEMLNAKRKVDKANNKRNNAMIASLIGDKKKEWKEKALAALTKAEENNLSYFSTYEDIEKADSNEELSQAEDLLLGDVFEKAENKHYFSTKERKNLAKKKEAMPDGSFPIRNTQDLKDAIRSVGRASNPEAAKRWIKKRARQLDAEDLLPDTWKAEDVANFNFIDMDLQKAEDLLLGKIEK
jgi:hypothetical protein